MIGLAARAGSGGGAAKSDRTSFFGAFGADPRGECLPPHPPLRIFGKMKGGWVVKALWYGYVTGPVLGVLWACVAATTVAVLLSFATGEAFPARALGLRRDRDPCRARRA